MCNLNFAEYIWLDGAQPTQGIRSKGRVVQVPTDPEPEDFPIWSFDGSSTEQASGEESDCLLKPVRVCRDPLRGPGNNLVLCEVGNPDGSAHSTTTRALLRRVICEAGPRMDPWIGFEQEYTLLDSGWPLGFPGNGFPGPQGPYYCGVGADRIFGRELAEAHARACLDAGLMLYGINAEVMPGQWEFQIGYRDLENEPGNALKVADHLWLARYLLHRVAEEHEVVVSFDNKPVQGDWNGAGMHTNFSTSDTRDPHHGLDSIHAAVDSLSKQHDFHIRCYGDGLEKRLTGLHETCDIATFKSGVGHRGASIRIPHPVALKGHGYLEDRRPGANADPYVVATCLIATVGNRGEIFGSVPQLADAA